MTACRACNSLHCSTEMLLAAFSAAEPTVSYRAGRQALQCYAVHSTGHPSQRCNSTPKHSTCHANCGLHSARAGISRPGSARPVDFSARPAAGPCMALVSLLVFVGACYVRTICKEMLRGVQSLEYCRWRLLLLGIPYCC